MPKKGMRVILKDGRSAVVQKNFTKASILVAFADGNTATISRGDIAEEIRRMCETCRTVEAMLNERYCKECKKAKLEELKESGYLQSAPPPPYFRGSNAENRKGRFHLNSVDEDPDAYRANLDRDS